MAKDLHDHARRHSLSQEQRRAGVPEVVEPLPRLRRSAFGAAGWKDHFVEQYRITYGKIVPIPRRARSRRNHKRDEGLQADYVLEYEPHLPVAVADAKRERKRPCDGLEQAMRYAELLLTGPAVMSALVPCAKNPLWLTGSLLTTITETRTSEKSMWIPATTAIRSAKLRESALRPRPHIRLVVFYRRS